MRIAGVIMGWIVLIVVSNRVRADYFHYPAGVAQVALVAVGVALALMTVNALRPGRLRWAPRAFVVVTVAAALSHLGMLSRVGPSFEVPPLLFFGILGGICANYAFSLRVGIMLSVAMSLLFAGFSVPTRRSLMLGALDGIYMVIMCLAVTRLLQLAYQIVTEAERSSARMIVLREATARATRRTYERRRWDGVVHDKFLGALQLGAREPESSQNSRELAADALAALDERRPGQSISTFADAVGRAASRLGLDVDLTTDGTLAASPVADALGQATTEALTNVARHAGVARASVAMVSDEDGVTVTIADRGRGFDRADAPTGRAGIALGIEERLRSIGGTAHIASGRGRGTTVTLRWRRGSGEDADSTRWRPGSLIALRDALVAVFLAHVAIGVFHDPEYRHDWAEWVGLAAFGAATVLAGIAGPSRRAWLATTALLAGASGFLSWELVAQAPLDWRFWWGGASTAAVALLVIRYGPRAGVATLGITIAVDAVAGSLGRPLPVEGLVWNYVIAVIGLVLAIMVKRGLDQTLAIIGRAASDEADLRGVLAEEQEVASEGARRRRQLSSEVEPLLRRLAAGEPVDEDARRAMVRAEARTRDSLVAGYLLDDALEARVDEARDRGVRVVLSARKAGRSVELDAFRSLAVAALDGAGARSSVTVAWTPSSGQPRRGTITMVGPRREASGDVHGIIEDARRRLRVEVSFDEDSVLIECYPLGAAGTLETAAV